jgi:membrane-bound serine protease (ClpP class)
MSTLAWPLVLLALGLVLLAAEVFLPTWGVLGALALGCLSLSLWESFRHSYRAGLLVLLSDLVLTPLTCGLAIYFLPRTRLFGLVRLEPPRPDEITVSHSARRLDQLVGRLGRAVTPLRPSGVVVFESGRLDGLSEHGLIPAGAVVVAVRVRSGQVVVRPSPDADANPGPYPDEAPD